MMDFVPVDEKRYRYAFHRYGASDSVMTNWPIPCVFAVRVGSWQARATQVHHLAFTFITTRPPEGTKRRRKLVQHFVIKYSIHVLYQTYTGRTGWSIRCHSISLNSPTINSTITGTYVFVLHKFLHKLFYLDFLVEISHLIILILLSRSFSTRCTDTSQGFTLSSVMVPMKVTLKGAIRKFSKLLFSPRHSSLRWRHTKITG